jgi:hypothetical protein
MSTNIKHTSTNIKHTSTNIKHTSTNITHTSTNITHTSTNITHTSTNIKHMISQYKDINTKKLFESLEEFDKFLISNKVKTEIYQQLIYILVILKNPFRNGIMPNTIITGSSKFFRSKLSKILSSIWISLNIIKQDDTHKNAECIICETNIIKDIMTEKRIKENSIEESLDWIIKFTRHIQNEHKTKDVEYKTISKSELSKIKDSNNKIIFVDDNSFTYDSELINDSISNYNNIIILSSDNKYTHNSFMWNFHIESSPCEIIYQELIDSQWQFESNVDLNWLKEITKNILSFDVSLIIFYISLEYAKEFLIDPKIPNNILSRKIILQGIYNFEKNIKADTILTIYS